MGIQPIGIGEVIGQHRHTRIDLREGIIYRRKIILLLPRIGKGESINDNYSNDDRSNKCVPGNG